MLFFFWPANGSLFTLKSEIGLGKCPFSRVSFLGLLTQQDYSAISNLPFLRQYHAGIIDYGVVVLNAYSARAGLSHHLLVSTQDGLQSRLWCSKHFYVNLQPSTANSACCITNHVLECSSRLISNHIWWLSKPNSRIVLECSTEWISNPSKWISKPKCRNVLECSIEWISNHIWWLSKPKCRNAPECSIEWNYPFFRETSATSVSSCDSPFFLADVIFNVKTVMPCIG